MVSRDHEIGVWEPLQYTRYISISDLENNIAKWAYFGCNETKYLILL